MATFDSTSVNTELDTEWNTGVIAKPTFYDGFEGEYAHNARSIVSDWDGEDYFNATTGPSTSIDNVNSVVSVAIFEATKADAKLSLSEVRRIINKKRDIPNAHWHVDSMIPTKDGSMYVFICRVTESYHNP